MRELVDGSRVLEVNWASVEALAGLPKELTKFTRHTLYRRRDLLSALEKIRRDGYSTNVGEWREQVGGMAVAIRDHAGRINQAVAAAAGQVLFVAAGGRAVNRVGAGPRHS